MKYYLSSSTDAWDRGNCYDLASY